MKKGKNEDKNEMELLNKLFEDYYDLPVQGLVSLTKTISGLFLHSSFGEKVLKIRIINIEPQANVSWNTSIPIVPNRFKMHQYNQTLCSFPGPRYKIIWWREITSHHTLIRVYWKPIFSFENSTAVEFQKLELSFSWEWFAWMMCALMKLWIPFYCITM